MLITIIIPIKDEPFIQNLVDEIEETIRQKHEIIIVAESQSIPEISEVGAIEIIVQRSKGLGNAFVEGLSGARGDIIALMDGDGSHSPRDLEKMLSKINEADIVLGSRLVKGGMSNDTPGRRLVAVALARLARLILWVDMKDPMTGFMIAKKNVFENLELKPIGFKIVAEIVYKSRARVIEVPISFQKREMGSSKAGFNINGLIELFRIFKLLFILRLGRIQGKW